VEECLEAAGPGDALAALQAKCTVQLLELCRMVARPLSTLQRLTLVALITADVHNRYAAHAGMAMRGSREQLQVYHVVFFAGQHRTFVEILLIQST
jgi:hypothetical protein